MKTEEKKRFKRSFKNFTSVNASRESMPSNDAHLKVKTPKENGLDVHQSRRNRRTSDYKNKKLSVSHSKQRKFPQHCAFSLPNYRNIPKTSQNLPMPKLCICGVRSLRMQTNAHSERSSEHENLPAFHNKSKFQSNSSVYESKKRSISHKNQRKLLRNFASLPCSLRYRNHPSTSLHDPMSKQGFSGVRPLRELSNVRVERVSEHENMPVFYSKPKFYGSSNPPLNIPFPFYDPTSHYYNINGCNENGFQTEEQQSCVCSALNSKKAVSTNTNMLVSNYIRNSSNPLNFPQLLPSSTRSSSERFYSRPLSFRTTHSTPHSNSAANNRNINQSSDYPLLPCDITPIGMATQTSSQYSAILNSIPKERRESLSSTLVEVGSMETSLEDTFASSSTAETSSLSESSQHLSALMLDVPPNSRASQTSSKESWDSEDGIISRLSFYSDYHRCKENLPHPELVSKESCPNNSPLKNENSSETSIFSEIRQSPSQLRKDLWPSTILISLLNEGKYIGNATGSISRYFPDSVILYCTPAIRPSNDLNATNSFEEKVRMNPTLDSKYSLKMPSVCPEESLRQHVGEFLKTSHPSGTVSSEEGYNTENTIESVRQSFASLSMTCIPPTTDASAITVASNEPNSDQILRSRNKAKKKWKLIACFTACFHLSTPKQKGQSCNFRESYIRK